MFDHFIVTRVDLHGAGPTEPSRAGFSTRILDNMLRRSLTLQTCQDFTLLTLWNGSDRGCLLPNEVDVTVPMSDNQFLNVAPSICAAVRRLARSEYVLITRTDSDDAWANDAFDVLQLAAFPALSLSLPYYLDIDELYQFELCSSTMVMRTVSSTYVSPFVSVLCRVDNLTFLDTMMRHHNATGTSTTGGMRVPGLRAMQLVHGRNVINRLRKYSSTSVTPDLFVGPGDLDVL